jgi:hypothetical protein
MATGLGENEVEEIFNGFKYELSKVHKLKDISNKMGRGSQIRSDSNFSRANDFYTSLLHF